MKMFLKANALEIKNTIIDFISSHGRMSQSEIYPELETFFPYNNVYELRRIVKEMIKDNILIEDIIFGGLKVK